jgi:hypothetical protein
MRKRGTRMLKQQRRLFFKQSYRIVTNHLA